MKKNLDITSDNIFEDDMNDLIIEGVNVTQVNQKNKNEIIDKLLLSELQRNNEAKEKQFYKKAFEITITILFLILVLSGLVFLLKQIGNTDKNLNTCIASGTSEARCLKSEGIY